MPLLAHVQLGFQISEDPGAAWNFLFHFDGICYLSVPVLFPELD